ncbi:hypothetical protein B0H10DRAFT_2237496 [Mycena sp. CBHHK59/15]|nr:hypothetical protein B0H10DRAFT_2237496 [Mycena sp. CBHHK59/15]
MVPAQATPVNPKASGQPPRPLTAPVKRKPSAKRAVGAADDEEPRANSVASAKRLTEALRKEMSGLINGLASRVSESNSDGHTLHAEFLATNHRIDSLQAILDDILAERHSVRTGRSDYASSAGVTEDGGSTDGRALSVDSGRLRTSDMRARRQEKCWAPSAGSDASRRSNKRAKHHGDHHVSDDGDDMEDVDYTGRPLTDRISHPAPTSSVPAVSRVYRSLERAAKEKTGVGPFPLPPKRGNTQRERDMATPATWTHDHRASGVPLPVPQWVSEVDDEGFVRANFPRHADALRFCALWTEWADHSDYYDMSAELTR